MRYILAFLWCAGSLLNGMAQMKNTIKGRVVNGESGEAIPNASVFITNTSKGTASGAGGMFELLDVPEGSYDLVVSSVGFETQVYTYKAAQLPLKLEVRLKPKVEELPDVIVEPDVKNGWEQWGLFFTDNFLGANEAGRRCKIKNYKTLRFRYSKSKKLLHIIADDPIIIENKALGYQVKYQLEDFHFDFNTHVLVYYGYSLFSALDPKGPSRQQLKNREKAYQGSIMHFMRTLYHDTLAGEGFELRRMVSTPNAKKEEVRRIYEQIVKRAVAEGRTVPRDSLEPYESIMRQPDKITVYGASLLTADSVLTKPDATGSRRLIFPDYLYIVYKNAREELDYLNYMHEFRSPYFQRSTLTLPARAPITIERSGNYYPPQALMMMGYWSWNEKVGNMLPLDYKIVDR